MTRAGPDRPSADVVERTSYAWRVLSVTGIGTVLAFFDGSALSIALPAIGRHFGAASDVVTWLVLAYLLALTAFILMFGRLADRVGRRRLYLGGMLLITVASVAGAFAPTLGFLVAVRAVQGVGGAAILANTTALITESFPAHILPVGLSLNLTVVSTATLLAPVISGGLVLGLSWRAVFLVPAVIGVLGMLWASRTLRRDGDTRPGTGRVGFTAPLLAAVCLAGLAYVCERGPGHAWTSYPLALAALGALAAGAAYVAVERRSSDPLIDLELFRVRARGMAFLAATAMILANSSLALLMSLYFQSVRGLDALAAGLGVMPSAVGVVVTSSVAGLLARRIATRLLSSVGLGLIAASLAGLALLLDADTPRLVVSAVLLVGGVGMGLFQGPNTAALMSTVPPRLRSTASAVRSTIQCTAQVVGVAIATSIVTAAAAGNRQALLAGRHNDALEKAHLLLGFHRAFAVLALVAAAGVLVSLSRGPARSGEVRPGGEPPAPDVPEPAGRARRSARLDQPSRW